MAHFKINQNDLFFILKEQLGYGSLCTLERYRDLNEKSLDLLVKEGIKFARGVVTPLQEIGDRNGVVWQDGAVSCPVEFKSVFKQYSEAGFTAVARDPEYGGQGFPHMMRIVINDLMYGACQAFNIAPSLTHGAAHLIESFADVELKERFVPRMYKGDWTGTMCLTEPEAGSNLAYIQTAARREGTHFKISGTKCFISYGEHDLTQNIIHLVLARIEGASEGVGGISLFIVPKIRVYSDGTLGRPNDIFCSKVESKLGLHGSPTCVLNFGSGDGCVGYLCGEENRGLHHMFQMMNQARINTAVSAVALASSAYQNTVAYTKERRQGSDVAKRKKGSVPIIDHPDVRRMLLWMKAVVEGMRSMIYSCAFWSDFALELDEGEEKKHYTDLVDFMTPIVKAYCSEMGFRVCETAIQCLGGYGYCRDFPLEQYLRDAKIFSIYEGTNGIQAMDLMGRKMTLDNGAQFKAFTAEIGNFCEQNKNHPDLGDKVRMLSGVSTRLGEVALEMKERKRNDPLQWASYTYPALQCFGEVTMTWRLLDMALKAIDKGIKKDFYKAKISQATYFCDVTLPLTMHRLKICLRTGREPLDMPKRAF